MSEFDLEEALVIVVILFLVMVFIGSDEFGTLAGRAIEAAAEFLRGLR